MNEIEFIDYVGRNTGKAYHWTTPRYDFIACLKPLNCWEQWSIRGGKNGKVRMLVGPEDFINVSAYIVDTLKGEVKTYRFQWTTFSEFEKYQGNLYPIKMSSITGCDPKPWWTDKKANSILQVLGNILDGTVFNEAFECGGIESSEYWEKELS